MLLGYFFAILIGFSLGLLGGGGSILTVPILVYILKMDPKVAIALSLAIVGTTSLFGVFKNVRHNNIEYKTAIIFGIFSAIGTLFGTKISVYLTGELQLLLFAGIMITASSFMFKDRIDHGHESFKIRYLLFLPQALMVGVITGVVGVGGGFLIVPALNIFAGLKMRKSIGTSLLLITFNSYIGFYGYLGTIAIPWSFLGIFTLLSIGGVFIGAALAQKVPQKRLKKIFAVFLIVMGFFILYKNRSVFAKSKAVTLNTYTLNSLS